MKTLKTKRKYFGVIYSFFKSLAPSKVPTIEDMEVIQDEIIPSLKGGCLEFVELNEKIDDLRKTLGMKLSQLKDEKEKELATKGAQEKLDLLNFSLIELNEKNEVSEVQLENRAYNLIFDIVSQNIKNLFRTIEDTIAFRKDLNEGNNKKEDKVENKK